jgi:hypothetical protein
MKQQDLENALLREGVQDRLAVATYARFAQQGFPEVSEAWTSGVQAGLLKYPELDETPSINAYAFAFEDGAASAFHRLKLILNAPEAHGRERDAIALALDPNLSAAQAIAQLRSQAERDKAQSAAQTGTVIPLRPVDHPKM